MTIKPISKNNVILKKGDKCIFSTLTYDYPNLKLDQKITITEVFDNGVVRVDNGTNIQVNVLANQIDKIIKKKTTITKDDFVNNIDHNFFKIEDLDQQSFILKTILRNQNNTVLETLNIYIKSKI